MQHFLRDPVEHLMAPGAQHDQLVETVVVGYVGVVMHFQVPFAGTTSLVTVSILCQRSSSKCLPLGPHPNFGEADFSEVRLDGVLGTSASGRGMPQRQKGDVVLLLPSLPNE